MVRSWLAAVGLAGLVLLQSGCAATGAGGAAAVPLQKGDRVVFLGDSITQGGGGAKGYITLVSNAVAKQKPGLGIEVFNAGISGNKVPDLQGRLDRDVLAKKPSLVIIYIGINDVWHWANGKGTTPEAYEAGLNDVIARLTKAKARAILCTPSVIGEKKVGENKQDAMLAQYSEISRKVAKKTGTPLIDLRLAFTDYLQYYNPQNEERGILTSDGVHLNEAGNRFVSRQMLLGLGLQIE